MTDDGRLACATYTHARRHPMVLGKIGDWTPPFQLTLPQLVVIVVVLGLEYLTWDLWAARLPLIPALILFLGLPVGLAWVVRRARVEGRSLLRTAMGWLAYLVRSTFDGVAGTRRASFLDEATVYVATGDPGTGPGPTRPAWGDGRRAPAGRTWAPGGRR